MDERLGFELDIDADTHKLPPAIQQLTLVNDKLANIGRSLERFEQGTRRMEGMERRARGVAGGFTEIASAVGLLERGLGVATKAWSVFDRAGDYAVKAMGERSATIRGYTQLLGGDKKQAGLEYYRAQEFAQKTDFSSEQIEKSQARLLAQGFRGKDLYATLFSAADLAAIMPGDKNQTLERVTMAMSQIKAKGKLQGEELTQQLAEAGLNTTLVKQQLAKAYGIKVGDVDKKLSAGQVGADVALPAIQRAILQQLGTSKAGEYSTSSAGSITALISNRDEAVKNLLKGFDADENLPGMDRYKKALKEQGALFDQNSKTGKQLSLVVQDFANAALDAKSAWSEFTNGFLDSFADSYTRTLNREGRDFNSEYTTQALHNLGEAIGKLGTVAAQAIGGTNNLVSVVAQLAANQANSVAATGKKINEGDYMGAALDAASGYLKNSLPYQVLKRTPHVWLANKAYNRYHSETLRLTPEEEHAKTIWGESILSRTNEEVAADRASMAARRVPQMAQVSKQEMRAAQAEASKGKADPYRGVFWDYQFNGGSTGRWAAPPTLAEFAKGTHTTASALTSIASRGPDGQQLIININGYNRDKMELAHAIANELARVARQPR